MLHYFAFKLYFEFFIRSHGKRNITETTYRITDRVFGALFVLILSGRRFPREVFGRPVVRAVFLF